MSKRRAPKRPAPAPDPEVVPPSEPPASGPDAEAGGLSAGKRRAFWAATLLLPLLFFALLEGGLRLAGYGADYPLFVDVEGAEGYRMPSREVASRYFANNSPPTPNPDFFRTAKPKGSFRVLVQGGSSAAGYPFYRGAAFPQILGTRLRLAYPDREVEVVNTAMAAVNSFTLLDFADEILEVEPDVVLIYAGHNEYYGALGAASTESVGGSPGLTRLYLSLRGLRTVQLLRNALAAAQRASSDREAGERPSSTLMARMVGEQDVPYGSDLYRDGLEQFEGNLDRLLARYERAGVPVYIGTLASNERDQRPFVTAHPEGADVDAWAALVQRGIALVEAGRAEAGVAALREATATDTLAADAYFVLGHALLSTGDRAGAASAFARARDLDALRFRAPSAFNDVIRAVAARRGATVVEVEGHLREVSPDGLVGHVTMLEHLHPTLDGYAAIADAFFDALVEDGRVGPSPQPTPPGRMVRLVTPMDSLSGLIRLDQLTASWPFREGEHRPLVLDTARTPPAALRFARATIAGRPWLVYADSLARLYEQIGDTRDALVTRRAIVQTYPFMALPYVHLANLELNRATAEGRGDRLPYIVGLYQQALDRDSTNADAHAMLGALALQAGDAGRGVFHLERAVRGGAGSRPLYNLAGAYGMLGRWDDAERASRQLLQMEPSNPRFLALAEGVRQRRL